MVRGPLGTPGSIFFGRKLLEKVWPVASDDTAYLRVGLSNVVEAFLDLLADHFEILWAEWAAMQELNGHATLPPPRGWRHGV